MRLFAALALIGLCISCGKGGGAAEVAQQLQCQAESQLAEVSVSTQKINDDVFSQAYGQFIITRKPGLKASGETLKTYSVKYTEIEVVDEHGDMDVVRLKDEAARYQLIEKLRNDDSIAYVEPDYPIEAEAISDSDPYITQQWSHVTVETENAWHISSGSEKIVVGIIDSGVDIDHPDLAANIWTNPNEKLNGKDDDGNGKVDDMHGWDFIYDDKDPSPDAVSGSSHGTHVAGVIGAIFENGIGIAGVSPHVQLMPLRFLKDDNGGLTSNVIKAIDYAISKKVKILNLSFGSKTYSQAFYDAITRAAKAGILLIVASGNNKLNLSQHNWYPTKYPHKNILTVAATNSSDSIWSSSGQGSNYSSTYVDVAAPGVNIYSTVNAGKYANKTGTSMAAPLVTGLAVLLKAKDSALTPEQIIYAIKKGVNPISSLSGKVAAGGRVNAYNSLKLVSEKSNFAVMMETDGIPSCY